MTYCYQILNCHVYFKYKKNKLSKVISLVFGKAENLHTYSFLQILRPLHLYYASGAPFARVFPNSCALPELICQPI